MEDLMRGYEEVKKELDESDRAYLDYLESLSPIEAISALGYLTYLLVRRHLIASKNPEEILHLYTASVATTTQSLFGPLAIQVYREAIELYLRGPFRQE